MTSTIVVSGMVAGTPRQGGATWAILQYLLGLRRLGFDTWLIEPVSEVTEARVSWCDAVLGPHGLADRWCLIGDDRSAAGASAAEAARRADLLLNVSGMLTAPEMLDEIPIRVYLDLDPAFVQLWHVEGVDMRFDAHTHFVTLSDAVGRTIPDCGRDWASTLPPVVLEEWPVAPDAERQVLTTVAHWRSYGSIEHEGRHYGQKAHAVRPLIDLPMRVDVDVEVALGIHPDEADDLRALRANGWHLLDPDQAAATPDDYRRFVQRSWAELGLAKSGYVESDSGWFSDRSACYLASGRPVLHLDTGFGRRLSTGRGLFAIEDVDDARAAVQRIREDEAGHRRAARAIAEEHLDSDVVLGKLVHTLL